MQNIADGSQASGTSRKMEMKLTNVACVSLEEPRLDYADFLRHRGLSQWERNDPKRAALIERRPNKIKDVEAWAKAVHVGQFIQSGQSGHGRPSTESTGATRHPAPKLPLTSHWAYLQNSQSG